MRVGVVLLVALSCAACALSKPAAHTPAPQAAAQLRPPPVADTGPAKFECSDGTISTSQDACLVAMARARLPPSQMGEPRAGNPAPAAEPAGTAH
jgi:hypothetical protein